MKAYNNQKIAILGFGIEGQSVIKYMLGKNARITVFDKKPESEFDQTLLQDFKKRGVRFVFGEFFDLDSYDLIIRSPGIQLSHEALKKIADKGRVYSSTKLFFDLCPGKIIGVTGTKGKGTTSTLIYEMLKKEGFDVYLGGNIGTPPLEFLEKLTPSSWIVLELSSFQLQDLEKSPHIAIVLMITSEHLDYHKDIEEYITAKRNIVRFQGVDDKMIVNRDYPASSELDIHTLATIYQVSRERGVIEDGCFVSDNEIILRLNRKEEKIIDIDKILLPGRHNLENVCAAVMASSLANVSKQSIVYVLTTFKGLPHRLELVRTINGVRYYDDSFSTTPETAIAAIEAFKEPKILILGGSSKGSDFSSLREVITDPKNNVKAIIGIGVEWERMKSQFQISNFPSASLRAGKFQIYEGIKNMEGVVKKASEIAEFGDVILLSPACASFGMFKNYKDRGDQFKIEVSKL